MNFGEVEADVQYVEQKTENIIASVLHWEQWEVISHVALAGLLCFVIYLLVTSPMERSLTNYLLLAIVVGLVVQIHQASNVRKAMGIDIDAHQ